jgi:hypothetical protein
LVPNQTLYQAEIHPENPNPNPKLTPITTSDFSLPNVVLYQAELHPDIGETRSEKAGANTP